MSLKAQIAAVESLIPDAMNKWRHLIEPTIAESGALVPWDKAIKKAGCVYEAESSVIVTHEISYMGEPCIHVWIAAGELSEVLALFELVELRAKEAGINRVTYLGRKGWIKTAGFAYAATLGVKEI